MKESNSYQFMAGLIAYIRDRKGLKCKQLADLLEKDYDYVYKLEKGQKRCSWDYLDFILKKLGMSMDEFMGYVPEYMAYRQQEAGKNK